jgi:hypothetical protein
LRARLPILQAHHVCEHAPAKCFHGRFRQMITLRGNFGDVTSLELGGSERG